MTLLYSELFFFDYKYSDHTEKIELEYQKYCLAYPDEEIKIEEYCLPLDKI